jgi:hypothetical protein
MQEIKDFTENLNKQRKTNTLLIGGFLAVGLMFSVPMFSDSIKHEETLYCTKGVKCDGYNVKRGISFLVDRERRNKTFDDNIKVLKVLPPEDGLGISLGLLSSVSLFLSFCVSRTLTNVQEEAIHSKFKILKIKAIENDILEQTHISLYEFSKNAQAEVTKNVISRDAQSTLSSLKSGRELELDNLRGNLEGQLALKNHQLQLSELEKETAKNNLEILELNKKTKELSKDKGKNKTEENPKENKKLDLIDALKSHEDGWLWTIISSLKPLWLIGNQGSGKTYTACTISLVRKYCLDAPIEYLIDRHATGDNADVWKYLQPKNIAEIEEDIAITMQDNILFWGDRIKQKPQDKLQVIVDEFTNLRGLIGELADKWFKLSLTDTRKAKCFLLGITHNDTNSSFAEGTKDTRKAGMILVQKFSANGETPLQRVVIRYGLVDSDGNNLEDVEKTLPAWFNPHTIQEHFNGKPINF